MPTFGGNRRVRRIDLIGSRSNRAEEADMVARLSTLERHDGYTVKGTFANFAAAHDTIWGAVELSFQGIRAQD